MSQVARRVRVSLLALCAAAGGVVMAGKYEDQVRASLTRVYDKLPSAYSRLSDLRTMETLDDGESSSVTYTLNSGYTYALIGVCDEDCDDLDLELRDENGNLIEKDVKDDDMPIVSVTPKYRGKFTLKVSMSSCDNSDGCVYGVDVFRK